MSKLWLENSNHPVSQWQETAPDGNWTDISNDICLCGKWGIRSGMGVDALVNHLKSLYDGVWATKSDNEKRCLASFCIASKTDRETISFVEEVSITNGYANHEFAIYDFIREENKGLLINELDYSSVRQLSQHLQRRNTWNKGSLVKVEYFETYDKATNTGTNLVLQVDITYYYDAYGQTDYRITERKWFLRDNTTIGVQTSSTKYYDYSEGVAEGVTRRGNNLNNLKVNVPGLIMQTESVDLPTAQQMGIPLFVAYGDQFKSYVEVKDPTIQSVISSDTNFTWLNNDIGGITIRQYLINELV